jgi:glycosyltransferase involved in cell wall biosynthesis
MNIFFDARWTRFDVHDGVSRYGASLVTSLAKLHPVTMIICDERQLNLLPSDVPYVKLCNPMSPQEMFTGRKLNKLGADVVFSPMQVMGAWGRRFKLIFTLHDVIYYQFPTPPHFLPPLARVAWRLFHMAKWPQRWLLNQADYVVTVSKTSKEFIQSMHLTDREIGVVYNAPSLTPIKRAAKPKKELVFMGSFMGYKNVELLLQALALLPDYKLHLISKITPQRKAELLELVENPEQVIFWNGAPDEQYNQVLKTAFALVSASRAEGFGLPLLEGMIQGVPVVATDMPIFHEVCGNAGTYFDAHSPQEFANAVRKLQEPGYYQTMVARSKQQAAKFNWDDSAKTLLKIIKQLHK